jgi:flavin-dependent dehydrogenase
MNSNSQKFRVAIIGAGTIGLYLAWKLSEAGHKVIVFEKNKEIEEKPCSGLISERLKNFIPVGQSLIENQISSCLIHFPKKTVTLNFKPTHFAINRRKGAKLLFTFAQKAGAKILLSQSINAIPSGFDRIIGCDGALSKIRESLSLSKPSFRLGFQTFLPIKDYSDFVETWPINNGFFWKIPRGSQTEYGAVGSLISIRKDFEKFCQDQKINFDQSELKSALIPQGLILPKDENITLCGDAAGLTKPWSGGGVIWGLTTANILIKNFPDFEKYRKEAKHFFRPKILFGKLSTAFVYFLGENFPFFLPKRVSIDNDFLFR